jgi:hypothetical protein
MYRLPADHSIDIINYHDTKFLPTLALIIARVCKGKNGIEKRIRTG